MWKHSERLFVLQSSTVAPTKSQTLLPLALRSLALTRPNSSSLWIIVINKSHNPLVLWVLCKWSIQHIITNRAPTRALSKVSYWEARPRRFLYVFLSPTNKAPYASLSIFFENRIYLGCFFKQNWGSKSHWSWQSKYRNKITVFQRKWRVQYKEIIQGSEMHFLYLLL